MVRKILVQALTLARVPLSLVFCAAVLNDASPFSLCAALFALIAASDYLDGKLARRFDVRSGIGAVLDVTVDFFFIILACSALSVRGLFPHWMLAVVIFKFLEFWITSSIGRRSRRSVFLFDPLGRIVAALLYLLPVSMLLLSLCLPSVAYRSTVQTICIVIAGLAVLSSSRRIRSLVERK